MWDKLATLCKEKKIIKMKREQNILLGTPRGIAKEVLKYVLENTINAESKFINCDFAVACDEEYETLAERKYNSSGWYGIKKINTGFDSDDLDLFADYYGGGCGIYNTLFDGMTPKDCIDIVQKMIIATMNITEYCDKNSILIAEFTK